MSEIVLFNVLKLSEEQCDTIASLAALHYSHHQMAIYLELDFLEFEKARKQTNSIVQFHITRGKLETQFHINDKIRINAEGGNITSAQEYNKAVNRIEIEQIKQKVLFYNED